MRKKTLSLIVSLLFFITGCVLLFLYLSKNISQYVPLPDSIKLLYFPIFLVGSISAFIVSIIFFILFLYQIKFDINNKVFAFVCVLIFSAFCVTNVISVIENYNAYHENIHFSDIDDEGNMYPPKEDISMLFPYYSDMEAKTEQTPFYSFSEHKLKNTVYKITQVYCSDYETGCSFTAEYFKSDKSYLFGKFISEKSMLLTAGENSELLDPSMIRQETYGDIQYNIVEQPTEKLILVNHGDYYFVFHYQDSMKALNLSQNQFIETAFEQLNYLSE